MATISLATVGDLMCGESFYAYRRGPRTGIAALGRDYLPPDLRALLARHDLALANAEFSASGSGIVRFPPAPAVPEVDLRVRLQPSAGMPQAHRDLLNRLPGSPPEASGARTYRIGGPIDAPQLGMP